MNELANKNNFIPQIRPLREHVEEVLEEYLHALDGHQPCDMHKLVMGEAERALLSTVLKYTEGNQSRASAYLNLNRGTLRKKLRQYGLSK